jgi:rhodanese-related sulfurtransferase
MDLFTFITHHPYLIGAAGVLAAMIATVEVRQLTRGFSDLGVVQAVQLVNADAAVVDVRSAERFQSGHIAGARNLPIDRLAEEAGKRLAPFKDRPLLIYCDSGLSGASAAAQLRKLGFAKVFNLRGGLEAWRRDSYPLERK